MKKSQILSLLFLSAIFAMSCSKDRDESAKGKFTYQSATYETNYATLVISGINKDTAILGFTKGLNTTGAVTGTAFAFVLGADKTLPAGSFTFKNLRDPNFDKTKNNFSVGLTVDYDRQLNTGTKNYLLGDVTGSSSLVIQKSGDKYEVTYNAVMTNGQALTGNYTGSVIVVQ